MNANKIKESSIWFVIRMLLGITFLWAFLDKTFGLGFATEKVDAWISGGSPTFGYLSFATKGPFAELFKVMAGSAIVEWLFMLGVLFIGVTLLTGILFRLGTIVGMAMYVLFYVSGFIPPEHNPVIDEHVINFVLMLGLFVTEPVEKLSLSKYWRSLEIVKKIYVATMMHHNHIQYIEFLSNDFDVVKRFYSGAFGWKFKDYGSEYTAFKGKHVDGGFGKGNPNPGSILVVIYSENLNKAQEAVLKHGGVIVKEIFKFPGGRRFEFDDPDGNTLAVWSDK